MRTKEEILADMLTLTTSIMFDVEKELFWDSWMAQGTKLLDVGCGNGSYLNRIRDSFPDAELTGIELNELMYREALRTSNESITYINGSYDRVPKGQFYDLVLMRLVIHHLPDKRHLADWLKAATHSRSAVLIIDIDEDSLHRNPQLPLFSDLYLKFRSLMPKTRLLKVKDALKLEFEHAGFIQRSCASYRIGGSEPSMKRRLHAYMRLVTEYLLGPNVPAGHWNELQAWLDDPAGTHSFHMFGMVLQNKEVGLYHREVSNGVV